MGNSNKEELDRLIEQSLDELRNDYKLRGDFGGWHQFFKNLKIGNVATSQALLLLKDSGVPFEYTSKPLKFLLDQQKQSPSITLNGGWSYITNLSDISNTESTCWVLQALRHILSADHDSVSKGLTWLLNNFIHAESGMGWGCVKESGFRTYSTCIALKTLKLYNKQDSSEFRAGLDSLKRIQNPDGGWGPVINAHSTLIHTAHCVITLMDAGLKTTSKNVKTGLDWIIKTLKMPSYQNGSSMGEVEIFDLNYTINEEKKSQRITFYHMPMCYAIRALLQAGSQEPLLIYSVIFRFMSENKHGHWTHPYLPDQTTTWAMYDVNTLFNSFKRSAYYENFDLQRNNSTGSKKFDIIIFTVVPVEFETLNKILGFVKPGQDNDYSINGFWYYKFDFENSKKEILKCLITMVGAAGDIDCSLACNTAFNNFDCSLAILCGIAAGRKKDVKKYSSVIGDTVVAYESQRWEKKKIEYRPREYAVKLALKRRIQNMAVDKSNWQKIFADCLENVKLKKALIKDINTSVLTFKSGTIASGAKLLADGKTIDVLRKKIPAEKGIIALEMEGSGFAPACIEHNKDWMIFRGISDYGEDDKNEKKNKKLQPLAVVSAAATMIYFLKYFFKKNEEQD